MSFTWPLVLLGLLGIPLVLLAYWYMQRRRSKFAVKFTNLDLLANVVDKTPGWRRHVAPVLYLLALGALIFAIARPTTTVAVPKEEATVVLVMDISGSMNATDVKPTRLTAAKDAAKTLVDTLPQKFQMALVAFSTTVQTLVSPTTDRDEILEAVKRLRANSGTSMGDAILQALDLVRPVELPDTATPAPNGTPTPAPPPAKDQTPAVIVLLSDGANSTGLALPADAASEAQARGVPIFTIALGTQEGVVEVPDQFGVLRRIAVPPDEETLKQIADVTSGQFFSAPSADDLKAVYEDLGSKVGYEDKSREVTAAFAGGGLVLLLLGGMASLFWFNRIP